MVTKTLKAFESLIFFSVASFMLYDEFTCFLFDSHKVKCSKTKCILSAGFWFFIGGCCLEEFAGFQFQL